MFAFIRSSIEILEHCLEHVQMCTEARQRAIKAISFAKSLKHDIENAVTCNVISPLPALFEILSESNIYLTNATMEVMAFVLLSESSGHVLVTQTAEAAPLIGVTMVFCPEELARPENARDIHEFLSSAISKPEYVIPVCTCQSHSVH